MIETDLLIIGSGAAGLTCGMYGARSGLDVYILDGNAGGQVLQIDNLENYPGVFPAVNGSVLIQNMQEQAVSFGVHIVSSFVSSIDKRDKYFYIKASQEEFKALSVVMATGVKHRTLDVKGEKEYAGRGVSYCAVCDGPFFKNRNVIVVGGGNSACTEALYLSKICKKVTLIHRRDSFRAAKTNVERVINNKKINVIYNTVIKEIQGGDKDINFGGVHSVLTENVVTGDELIMETDAVFVFVGNIPNNSLLEMLHKDETGYVITDDKMGTPIPGLYCAGDLRSKPLRQIVTACSDGAIAAISSCKYIEEIKKH